jgi:hypothetical protein
MIELNFQSFVIFEKKSASGVRLALPMGVAPEATVEIYLFEYRLKFSLNVIVIFVLHKIYLSHIFLSGARSALPMGVAPEAIMGCLQPIIDSKNLVSLTGKNS